MSLQVMLEQLCAGEGLTAGPFSRCFKPLWHPIRQLWRCQVFRRFRIQQMQRRCELACPNLTPQENKRKVVLSNIAKLSRTSAVRPFRSLENTHDDTPRLLDSLSRLDEPICSEYLPRTLRALCNGKTSAFQAEDAGSIPAARSTHPLQLALERCPLPDRAIAIAPTTNWYAQLSSRGP